MEHGVQQRKTPNTLVQLEERIKELEERLVTAKDALAILERNPEIERFAELWSHI